MKLLKNKEYKKRLERWFGRQWVKAIILSAHFLTVQRARRLGRVLGILGYYLITRHRRAALRNIRMIYKNKNSERQLRKIIRHSFINASCFGCEVFYFYTHRASDQEIDALFKTVEGLPNLEQAFRRGQGIIGLGAHLGNFTLLGRKLNALGIPNSAIMRQMRDKQLETVFKIMREGFGQHWIPKFPLSRAIRESMAWLKQGNLLMMYVDQRSGRGVRLDFMGVPTPTPTGAAAFALKTGACVLPIVNVLDGDGYYKLLIGEEVPVARTGDHKKDIALNTQNFNRIIEKYILRYPEQWFWFHNRWKGVRQNEI